MDDKDIKLLSKLLKQKGRIDLSELLIGSKGSINESSQYGSYYNSVISTFEIHAPVEKYFLLKELDEDDRKTIFDLILDIYPHKDEAPEIVSVNIRLLKEDDSIMHQEKIVASSINSIRIFISYSHEDKILAGQIKQYLENFKLEVFLAHEDISPSLEWQNVILQNLESIDIFIPLFSNNFIHSKWTDQESGFALAKNKFIIPISLDNTKPYGFIGKFQSLNISDASVNTGSYNIVETILNNEKFSDRMLNLLIDSYENSLSFEQAGKRLALILKAENLTKEQLSKIMTVAIENNQIKYSFKGRENLQAILNKHKQLVDKELFLKLNNSVEKDDFQYTIS